MSKFSTLNYLISSYQAGKNEVEFLFTDNQMLLNEEFEPSQTSINAILGFAAQFDVVKSEQTGSIELNLN